MGVVCVCSVIMDFNSQSMDDAMFYEPSAPSVTRGRGRGRGHLPSKSQGVGVCGINPRLDKLTQAKNSLFSYKITVEVKHQTEDDLSRTFALGEADPSTVATVVGRTATVLQNSFDSGLQTLQFDFDTRTADRETRSAAERRRKRLMDAVGREEGGSGSKVVEEKPPAAVADGEQATLLKLLGGKKGKKLLAALAAEGIDYE